MVMHQTTFAASIAVLAGLLAGSAWSDPVSDTQAARWAPKKLDFKYFGFTTIYSCDGLHDAVKSALLQLGARKDLIVTETGCDRGAGRPTPFPGVSIKMNVLQPVDTAKDSASGVAPVGVHWKTVTLKFDQGSIVSSPGTCELAEQINHSILPLFTTRNVKFSANCIPHQQSVGGPLLRADVLVVDDKAVAASRG